MNFFWFLITAAVSLAGLLWFVFFFFAGSGWSQFAKAYPAGQSPAGQWFIVTGIFAGGPTYGRCVAVTISRDGLHIGTPLPLHPSFFVPWSAVRSCSREKHLFSSSVDVTIPGSSDLLILRFPPRALPDLQPHFPSLRSEPPPLPQNA